MPDFAAPIARLIDELKHLPGIGQKTAQRLAYHLLRVSPEGALALAEAIRDAKEKIRECSVCNNITDTDPCLYCTNPARNRKTICVVEEPNNILAVEKTRHYSGLYHVLGGALAPLQGVGPEQLKIKSLIERLKNGAVEEIIIATNPTAEGEATAEYLSKLLKPLGVRVTRIGVRVGLLGFQSLVDTLTLAAGDSLERDYRLVPAVVPLEPVIVTAAKHSQLLSQVVTSVALVSDTDVARRAVTTVDEAVDKAPGVQFLNGQVNIRGSSGYVQGLGSRVLMLVDGVPANQGDRGGINWDLVPLEDVARVEVVKGAGSALYGSAALGGVVNVITREIPTGFHARIRALGGAYANPPFDVWKFRDYTGAQEGLDLSTSYGTAVARGSYTADGWHRAGYRDEARRNHWQSAGKAEWRPAPGPAGTGAGSWASDQYQVP